MVTQIWLHYFLGRIATKYPEFFDKFLDDLEITKRQKIIMLARYRDKLTWKEIPDVEGVNCELQNVMKIHRRVIDKIIRL